MKRTLKTILCLILAATLALSFTACEKAPETDPAKQSEEPTVLSPVPFVDPHHNMENVTETDIGNWSEEPKEDTVISWNPGYFEKYWGEASITFGSETGYTLKQDMDLRDRCRIYTTDCDEIQFDFYVLDYATGLAPLIAHMKTQNPLKLYYNDDTKLLIEVHSREKTEVNARINDSCCLTIIGPNLEAIQRVLNHIHIRIQDKEYDPMAGSNSLTILYGQDE